ncbi:MAG: inositol monophosphatase family protein [Planctomycetota bacterium]
MPPTTDQIDARLRFALKLADEARAVTLPWADRRGGIVESKGDGSPVTEADRACERLIRDRVAEEFAGDAVLGEEFEDTAGTSGYRWIIDPIDGTFSFMRGVPLWSTLIAVEHEDEPGRSVAGVIDLPALSERVYAHRGGGCWHELGSNKARRFEVNGKADLKTSCACFTSIDSFRINDQELALESLRTRTGFTRGWSDAYAAVLVATGRAEIAIEPEVKPFDIATWDIIATEAGGMMTDWTGTQTFRGGSAVMTNGRLHNELLALIRG